MRQPQPYEVLPEAPVLGFIFPFPYLSFQYNFYWNTTCFCLIIIPQKTMWVHWFSKNISAMLINSGKPPCPWSRNGLRAVIFHFLSYLLKFTQLLNSSNYPILFKFIQLSGLWDYESNNLPLTVNFGWTLLHYQMLGAMDTTVFLRGHTAFCDSLQLSDGIECIQGWAKVGLQL